MIKELMAPIPIEEIGWVPSWAKSDKIGLSAYVDKEFVLRRLHEVVGKYDVVFTSVTPASNLSEAYAVCEIRIPGEGVKGGVGTHKNDVKNASSDAIKRAGAAWGIGFGMRWNMVWPWVKTNGKGNHEPNHHMGGYMPYGMEERNAYFSDFVKNEHGIIELSGSGLIWADKPPHPAARSTSAAPSPSPTEAIRKMWDTASRLGDTTTTKFKNDWYKVAMKAAEKSGGDEDEIRKILALIEEKIGAPDTKAYKDLKSMVGG